ncbi:MAG TPA: tetratricopeptide repeat protein [Polyangiales bacterium]|nr:tetratricopeptide repeat protein [Polyangiales bacterium]
MFAPRNTLLASGLLLLALAQACGDDEKKTAAVGPAATSGGEDVSASSTAMAKQVPKGQPGTPQDGLEPKSSVQKPVLQQTKPVQLVAVATNQANGPSLWGAPDAESGAPLPPRKNNAYLTEYNEGVKADRAGKPDEALQHYGKSLRIQPDYEMAVAGAVAIMLRRGSPTSAVSYVQPIATQWERNLYLQAIYADVLVRADRIDEGEQVARKALRRDERFVPAIVALAKASLRRGRVELAQAMLDQAAEIDPKYPEVHFLQGKASQEKGDLAQALTSYRKAVELRPDYAEARMALGMQYMASGNYNEALTQFDATIKLVPTLTAAHLNLGDAYRALRRWQDAKKEFDTALRMQAELPEAHFDLALLYMSALAEFPGLTVLDAYDRSLTEFNTYRQQMGPRLQSDDPSAAYMADIQRSQEREKKRIEREKAKAEKEAARKAKAAGQAAPAPAPAPAGKTK